MIGIIGKGFVGSAIASAYKKQDIKFYDPAIDGSVNSISDLLDCEAIFICLPSPQCEDGSCNYGYVDYALSVLYRAKYSGLVIGKSTVPYFVYTNYSFCGLNVVFIPEFLRAATAVEDYNSLEYMIVGTDNNNLIEQVKIICQERIEHSRPIKFKGVTIKEACLVKYFENSFLATKVSLMNEFRDLTVAMNANWENVISALTMDSRICPDHTQVPGPDGKFGWGGHCLPKDTSALLYIANESGIKLATLEAAIMSNKKYRDIV